MADYLLANWEGGGNVAPFVGAVRRLRARGHRVRLLGDDAMRAEAEAAGAEFRPWRRPPNRPDRRPETCHLRDWEATEPGGGLLRVLDRMMIGPAADYAADTLDELRRAPADAVVTSDMLFGPMIAAEAAGVPFAALSTNLSFLPIEGMPAMGPGLPPPRTEEERAAAAGVEAWMRGQMAGRLPTLNAARARFGLPPLADALEQPRAAGMVLLATSRAFDFPVPRLPEGMRYIGPLLDAPDWARGWRTPWAPDDPRPLVLVAMSSTFQDQAGAMQNLLDAAAGMPVRMVVTLGPALAGTALRAPPNAAVVDAASHAALMREAALVVTHAGHGTVMRALWHHRPMLCLPMGRDQNDNAARVVWHGAGLRLAPDAPAAELRGALETLLAEPRYAASAAALGRAIAAAQPPDALVTALEDLVAGPCRHAA